MTDARRTRMPLRAEIAATEMPQYRRLVGFLQQVAVYADQECDPGLRATVDSCTLDLLRMRGGQ
jgi:hypothetical protein